MPTQTLMSATELAKQGRFEEAKRVAEQRVRRAPNDPEGWLVLAEVTDELEHAVRCMEHVVRLRPNDSRSLERMHALRKRLQDQDMDLFYTEFEGLTAALAAQHSATPDALSLIGAGVGGLLLGVIGTLLVLFMLGVFA